MAQNFKRKYAFSPEKDLQNKLNDKELNLIKKADDETFIKDNIFITPMKENEINFSIMKRPTPLKREHLDIPTYEPLSFSDFDKNINYDNNFEVKNNITQFDDEKIFNIKKKTKLYFSKNDIDNILYYDNSNKKYSFRKIKDKDLTMDNNEISDANKLIILNSKNDENSDEEKIQKDTNICFKEIEKGIELFSKSTNSVSRHSLIHSIIKKKEK